MSGSALPIDPSKDTPGGRSDLLAKVGPTSASEAPLVRLDHLDTLWFQVTGTICNLRCTHCFIDCAPDNHSFEFLGLEEVEDWLVRSETWGVRDYYFTGGEPFMHADLPIMLERTLERGPASVLTNGTLLPDRALDPIVRVAQASPYSLEVRVSLDGPSPESNDPIRGEGTFDRAMEGIRKLLARGFLPIITATQVWDPVRDTEIIKQLESKVSKLDAKIILLEERLNNRSEYDRHLIRYQYYVLMRELHELRLSIELNNRKLAQQGNPDEEYLYSPDPEIAKIGAQLNELRIMRRIYDYIVKVSD